MKKIKVKSIHIINKSDPIMDSCGTPEEAVDSTPKHNAYSHFLARGFDLLT